MSQLPKFLCPSGRANLSVPSREGVDRPESQPDIFETPGRGRPAQTSPLHFRPSPLSRSAAPGRPGVGRGAESGKLTGAEYVLDNLTRCPAPQYSLPQRNV